MPGREPEFVQEGVKSAPRAEVVPGAEAGAGARDRGSYAPCGQPSGHNENKAWYEPVYPQRSTAVIRSHQIHSELAGSRELPRPRAAQ